MIILRNTQRSRLLDLNKIKHDLEILLAALRYSDFDLGIWFTNNTTIRKFNREYRNKDKATDILSFPYHPELKAGQRIKAKAQEDKNLGDLIISIPYVEQEAEKYRVTFDARLDLLLVHGICHLLGYDHIEDADYRRMRAKESWLLRKLHQERT